MITPGELRALLGGLAEVPAPPGEDANDATDREALNVRNMEIANRLHAVALDAVNRYAPGTPDSLKTEAIIRTAGYLHADAPGARVMRRLEVSDHVTIEPRAPGSPLRLSGAAALLSMYRVRRAARVEAPA